MNTETEQRRGNEYDSLIPQAFIAVGLLFILLIPVEWAVLSLVRPEPNLAVHYAITFVLNGLPALLIAYGGYKLDRSQVETDQYRRIAKWCFGGLVLFLAVNLVMIAVWPTGSLRNDVGWARGTAIFGALGGLIIGGIEARAVHRARVAERELAQTEYVEAQRQWLSYMNSLLRHEVLNAANVIEGYSTLLIDEQQDDSAVDRLEIIHRKSQNMSKVIDDVRVLIEATQESGEFVATNLTEELLDEVGELRMTHPEADVTTDCPTDVYVMADSLLPRLFSNLLTNAVEHNDGSPHVSVSMETADETVAVFIEDDGPGISPRQQATLFEGDTHTSNHGLGLYLVQTLAERYGGTVELRSSDSDGSVFVVELPIVRTEQIESGEPEPAPAGLVA